VSDLPELPGRGLRPVEVALAVPVADGRVLVLRRPAGIHLEGTWEFPGGKIDDGEEPVAAARRELVEETGLRARELEPLIVVVHEYPERPVRLHVFLARNPEGEVRPVPPREWAWRPPAELGGDEMPPANAAILRALQWRSR
jgi:8-oxo-dGTP diphosphatase